MSAKVSNTVKKVPAKKLTQALIVKNTNVAIKQMQQFKFSDWKPVVGKVDDMPTDAIAPKPDSERFVKLKDRVPDLSERRKKYILKKMVEMADAVERNKTSMNDLPRLQKVALGKLVIVTDVQRPLDENHVIDIILKWDSRNFRTPKCSYDPLRDEIGVTDGQHRVIALRERIIMGLVPECDPDDWENFEIWVEITDLEVNNGVTDYSPCREQFLGENGNYTKKVEEFDMLLNEVAGKLVDSPNQETKPEYEKAARRYLMLKNEGITCVHTRDKKNRVKASSFTGVRYLRDESLTDAEVLAIAKHHHAYWRHDPMSDIEILPVARLIREIEGSSYYNSKDKSKVKEKDDFLLKCNAVIHNVAGDWDNFKNIAVETWKEMCTSVRQTEDAVPDDLSLALLLQLTKKAGATHPSIKHSWYTKYKFNNTELFNCLSAEKQALF